MVSLQSIAPSFAMMQSSALLSLQSNALQAQGIATLYLRASCIAIRFSSTQRHQSALHTQPTTKKEHYMNKTLHVDRLALETLKRKTQHKRNSAYSITAYSMNKCPLPETPQVRVRCIADDVQGMRFEYYI